MSDLIQSSRSDDLAEMDSEEDFTFPPAERRLVTQPLDLSVQSLFEQWKESLLILPEIQREYVWDNGKASRLAESIILNIPIPVMYFAETEEAKYEIYDGHQRVRSISRFINNEFPLTGLDILREYQGQRYYQLPEKEQRFFRMRTLRIILISIDSHPSMKFEIYARLNTGSIALNAQELRNSIYRGTLNDLLHELARDETFRALLGAKTVRRRMVDEELILRFFAVSRNMKEYRTPLKRFLNNFMKSKQHLDSSELDEYRTGFRQTVEAVFAGLGSSAFRVLASDGKPSEPSVNRALFEAEMIAFSWVMSDHRAINKRQVKREFAKLFNDETFLDAIQRATGDRARMLTRLRKAVSALEKAGEVVDVPRDTLS